jgi:propionyl-CoA carboxylase alpha chain
VYRLFHWGVQADVQVMSARAAELQALMPVKAAPDTSEVPAVADARGC